ncbi:phage minor head protein [Labrys neptuniae]
MCIHCRQLTLDRATGGSRERSPFVKARKLEIQYATQLRKVARHVHDIVQAFEPGDFSIIGRMRAALERYGRALTPWAEAVAGRMIAETDASEKKAWASMSQQIGRDLSGLIRNAPVGERTRQLQAEQVTLITSLPIEAAERVHRLAVEAVENGSRGKAIVEEIMRTGEVTIGRANTIARTETSRVHTILRQSRAQAIGSTHFIWRTSRDANVRPTHRALEGKAFRWDEPPECDPGYHALPGAIWNCRCWPEAILPERF